MKSRSILFMIILSLVLLTFMGCPAKFEDVTSERLDQLMIHTQQKVQNLDSWNIWDEYSLLVTFTNTVDGSNSKIYCETVNGKVDTIFVTYYQLDGPNYYEKVTWYIDGIRYYEDDHEKKFWEEPGDNEYETLPESIMPALKEVIRYCFENQGVYMTNYYGYTINSDPYLNLETSIPIATPYGGTITQIRFSYFRFAREWPGELRSIGFTMDDGTTLSVSESDNKGFYDDMSSTRAQYEADMEG